VCATDSCFCCGAVSALGWLHPLKIAIAANDDNTIRLIFSPLKKVRELYSQKVNPRFRDFLFNQRLTQI